MDLLSQFIEFNSVVIKIFLLFVISFGLIFIVDRVLKKILDAKLPDAVFAILFFLSCMVVTSILFSQVLFESAIMVTSLGILLLLPGYLTWHIFLKTDNSDFFETLFTIIAISIIVSSIAGLLLSFSGHFSLYGTLLLILVFSALLYLFGNPGFRNTDNDSDIPGKTDEKKSPDQKEIFIVLAILFFSALLFLHPFEYIWGGADAGVYLNSGATIAKTGSIWIHDPLFQLRGPSDVHYFLDNQPGTLSIVNPINYEGLRFPGYYIDSYSDGIVIPQFLCLYPVWIALFYSFGGISSSLYVIPVFAVISILAIFYLVKRMFGLNVATLSVFFLMINLQQLWSARMSLTEIIVQFFLFCGLYLYYRYYSSKNNYFLLLSAFAIGLIFFTRIDSLLLIPVICMMMVLLYLQSGEKNSQNNSIISLDFFSIPIISIIIISFVLNSYFSRPYLYESMKSVVGMTPTVVYFVISCVMIGFFVLLKLNWLKPHTITNYLYNQRLPMIFSLTAILLFIFLFFIRPVFTGSDSAMFGTTLLNLYNNENFVRLSWYMSEIGLIFSFSGIILMLNKDYKKSFLLLLTFAVPFVYYMINIENNPVHIYAFRRLLPEVIPIMTIFIAYFCINIYDLKITAPESKMFTWLSGFFVITMFFSLLAITSPMITHVEFQGAVQSASDISNLTPPVDSKSIIYFQDDDPEGPYHYLSTPLTYLFDKITLNIPVKNKDTIENHILINNSTYLITKNGAIPVLNPANLTKIGDYSIDIPLFEKSYTELPTNISRFKMAISIYKIEK